MRSLILAVSLVSLLGCGHSRQIQNLPLAWKGVEQGPRASPSVERAFTRVPLTLSPLRDQRPDPSAVGTDQADGHVVRTSDNVGAYYGDRFREMFRSAGAQLQAQGATQVDVEIVELSVVEAGMFNGLARLRVTVTSGNAPAWVKLYEGKSKRWGRTHNPENYNEALSNAFMEATRRVLTDETFAEALLGQVRSPGSPAGPSYL